MIGLRIIKVSKDEVNVYLTEKELEYFDINPDEKKFQAGELHRFLYAIMEVVRSETGFDPYHGGQVMVEASPTCNNGMNLAISKIGFENKRKHRISREQFKNIKTVKVRSSHSLDTEQLSMKDIERIVDKMGIDDYIKNKLKKMRSVNMTFVFDTFKDMETGLCMLPDEIVKDCALYRNGNRYAVVSELVRCNKYSFILGEYASGIFDTELATADIGENWSLVAEGSELIKMTDAMKNMK